MLAMEKGNAGESYIIAGPLHTLTDALAIAQRATGIPAPRLQAPPALLKAMSGMMSVVERFIKPPDTYTREGRRASAGVTYLATNEKARREQGYAPRPLETGLTETIRAEMTQMGITSRT